MSDQRYEHYYSLEADHEIEEGHIFCTIDEGQEIERALKAALPDVDVVVEPGGEYDYTTEDGTSAASVAASILQETGFISPAQPMP